MLFFVHLAFRNGDLVKRKMVNIFSFVFKHLVMKACKYAVMNFHPYQQWPFTYCYCLGYSCSLNMKTGRTNRFSNMNHTNYVVANFEFNLTADF